MAKRDVVTYPQATLRKKSTAIVEIGQDIRDLIRDMRETMYSSQGIGLAAPQVGVNQKVIVVDVTIYQPEQKPFALINPEIVSGEGEVESTEGCLSVPGVLETIKRNEKVTVRGLSEEGEQVEIEATGMLAICLQHEIDHLNGMTIVERLSPIKRELVRKRLKKAVRKES
jgi:peptide deformylase